MMTYRNGRGGFVVLSDKPLVQVEFGSSVGTSALSDVPPVRVGVRGNGRLLMNRQPGGTDNVPRPRHFKVE